MNAPHSTPNFSQYGYGGNTAQMLRQPASNQNPSQSMNGHGHDNHHEHDKAPDHDQHEHDQHNVQHDHDHDTRYDNQVQESVDEATAMRNQVTLDIHRHGIHMVLPKGASLKGATLILDGGLLVYGEMVDCDVRCKKGTLIICEGGFFSGNARAPRIMIAGNVENTTSGRPSNLTGDLLIAISQLAFGRANLFSTLMSTFTRNFTGHFMPIDPKRVKNDNGDDGDLNHGGYMVDGGDSDGGGGD